MTFQNKVLMVLSLYAVSVFTSASCISNNALEGYWTFSLRGSAVVDDFGGTLDYSSYNSNQIMMQGKFQFNSQSTLIRGNASDMSDLLLVALNAIELDEESYQGLVVDKKMMMDGVKFNRWRKKINKCDSGSIRLGFRGLDTVDGRVFNKTYCVLGMSLAKNNHTAMLGGYCMQDRILDGSVGLMFAPVQGMMQQRFGKGT